MEIKILSKIHFWDILLIILVSFCCWILLRAILPSYPTSLTKPYNLCDTSDHLVITSQTKTDHLTLSCKTKIPVDVLFRAKAIYVSVYSNQEVSMKVFLHGKGSGPYPTSQRIFPKLSKEVNLVAFDLDEINRPKINWLVGDYDGVTFEINNFKSLDSITVNIQKVYLK